MSADTGASAIDQVRDLIDEVIDDDVAEENVERALVEVNTLLRATDDSLLKICRAVEGATSQDTLRLVFRRLNKVIRMFYEAAPNVRHQRLVKDAVSALPATSRFSNILQTVDTVQLAVKEYKSVVIQDLVVSLRQAEMLEHLDDAKDDALFSEFFAKPRAPDPQVMIAQRSQVLEGTSAFHARKRGVSQVVNWDPIPKKSRIPALASLSQLSTIAATEGTQKKRVLVTREKLKAGLHDPKGLLNLVGPSTNALERTKKLELLKSSGLLFNSQNKSFSDKLTAAILSLELGLAGHAVEDTLLFGAKVLSTPGSLKPAHVSDIENNITSGNATWSHQNSYAKMMIAGALNQAKRVIEKYDEGLYGPAPEVLVEETHDSIRKLLSTEVARQFVDECQTADPVELLKYDDFVKKIVEAVSPIIPIALRNKSLDGGFLRIALHFLEAADLLLLN